MIWRIKFLYDEGLTGSNIVFLNDPAPGMPTFYIVLRINLSTRTRQPLEMPPLAYEMHDVFALCIHAYKGDMSILQISISQLKEANITVAAAIENFSQNPLYKALI